MEYIKKVGSYLFNNKLTNFSNKTNEDHSQNNGCNIDLNNYAITKKDRNSVVNVIQNRNQDLFLSEDNVDWLIKKLYIKHQENGGTKSIQYFRIVVPEIMNIWVEKNQINDFEELRAGCIDDMLRYINDRFVKENSFLYNENLDTSKTFAYHYGNNADNGASDNAYNTHNTYNTYNTHNDTHENIFKIPDFVETNPYKLNARIDHYDRNGNYSYEIKNYKDLSAVDMEQLRVWELLSVETDSSKYRHNNKIEKDRISRHVRNYDRDNEGQGLRYDNSDRSSLDNPIRGFNMEDIYAIKNINGAVPIFKPTRATRTYYSNM